LLPPDLTCRWRADAASTNIGAKVVRTTPEKTGRKFMSVRRTIARAGAGALLLAWVAMPAAAQQPAQQAPANPGKDLVASKCFQCHTDSMFRDGRQDRRAWEAVIYRMVARGGLYTADEIKLMADYLGDALGPNAPRAETKKQ
jgi:mono/diheme cytochrome c family protein